MYANFVIGLDNGNGTDNDGNPIPLLLGPTVQLSLRSFPSSYTFATNILLGNIDLTKDHSIMAKVYRKDNEDDVLFDLNMDLPRSFNENDNNTAINLSGEVRNAYFTSEGEYRCIVTVDGEELCDNPLYVTREVQG